MDLSDDDRRALTELSHRYASHVDDRDWSALGALFTEDAVLVSGAGPREGRSAILAAMLGLERYGRTFHLVGQVRLWVEADGPHGETYCLAHHFTEADDGTLTDRVLHIRYHDTYAVDSRLRDAGPPDTGPIEPGWRFARRELDIVATTTARA